MLQDYGLSIEYAASLVEYTVSKLESIQRTAARLFFALLSFQGIQVLLTSLLIYHCYRQEELKLN